MSLIRKAIRLLDGLKHKQCPIQCGAQIGGTGLGAAQVGNNFSLANYSAVNANAGACANQTNIYQANQMAERGNSFKGYDGAVSGLNGQGGTSYQNASHGLNVF